MKTIIKWFIRVMIYVMFCKFCIDNIDSKTWLMFWGGVGGFVFYTWKDEE